jgi:DNA-binding PadR family transcriptional regulator
MRLSGRWMKGADDRILEFLDEEGPSSPKKMHDDGRVRFSRGYINARCQELAEHGLVQTLGNGIYQITEDGEAYLAGELDTGEDVEGNGERRASA